MATRSDDINVRSKLSVQCTAVILILIVMAITFEGLARFSERYIQELSVVAKSVFSLSTSDAHLDAYEVTDETRINHWHLRPNFQIPLSNIKYYQKPDKRFINLDALNYSLLLGNEGEIGVIVNSNGFKGLELDPNRKRIRVLALGDSTTFGTGPFDYTIFMQSYFDRTKVPVEVVNGGVEGYRPRNLLFELDRYKSINPEIVTIFIGWNALFSDAGYTNWLYKQSAAIRLFAKVMRYVHYVNSDPVSEANKLLSKEKQVDRSAAEVQSLDDYWPESIAKIAKLAEEVRSMNAIPILVTLPGLYTMGEHPDEQGLRIGHLPEGTDNTFVLAKLTERYNLAIKSLAIEEGYPVIDLANWSEKTFVPRSYYFTDSVHLAGWSMELVGHQMAKFLTGIIQEKFGDRLPVH